MFTRSGAPRRARRAAGCDRVPVEAQRDVLVVGGGPAGRALAVECATRGLSTTVVDPAPDRPWAATYASWSDALPAELPTHVVASRCAGRAVAVGRHDLGWEYAVLDSAALHTHLAAAFADAGGEVLTGRVVAAGPDGAVLADGTSLRARVVVDAGGAAQPLNGTAAPRGAERRPPLVAVGAGARTPAPLERPTRGAGRAPRRDGASAAQTAYGLVVDAAVAAPFVSAGEALFMDWRPDHGEPGPPTFLYAVPLGDGQVLLEETSLAARPGLPLPVLQRRLHARLAHHGIVAPVEVRVEKVAFPLDRPLHRGRYAVGFGAAAPMVHPASGFSVAAALTRAPGLAEALARHLPADPEAARRAAHRVVWPAQARAVRLFRRVGLEALLAMPPQQVPEFFEAFFDLPPAARWAYLTGDADLAGAVGTMSTLFRRSSGAIRRRLLDPRLLPRAWDGPSTSR